MFASEILEGKLRSISLQWTLAIFHIAVSAEWTTVRN